MIHSILPVQITCLAIFLHNLSPCPLWSTSWSGALHPIFHPVPTRSIITVENMTDISNINALGELASTRAVRSEDGRAVAVRVLIDETDGVVKRVYFQAAQNRSENLLFVARHLRLNMSCHTRKHHKLATQLTVHGASKTISEINVKVPHHNPFTALFRDHPGEPVPEENFWTLWCKGRLTEADTPTI